MEKNKSKSLTGFFVGITIVSILYLILLEFSKNRIFGWPIAILVIAGFIVTRVARRERFKGFIAFLCWVSFFALLSVNLMISAPEEQLVPAYEGSKPSVTGIVHVKQGDITGVYNEDKTVEIYAGIPYAKPPVGDLRWREPEALEDYTEVRACDHFGPMAMQQVNPPLYNSLYDIIGFHKYNISLYDNYREKASEDCLYLNVFAPAERGEDKLPVIFYVHGGSLTTGQSYYSEYRGDDLAKKGVIFVNFAYRLGVFGYYANEELASESPNGTTGNYGLLDQIAALKWVKENIEAFGGDPANITIAGESAGSSSVNALCVSPLTEGLFTRAIAESSSILAKKPYHTFRTMKSALETGNKVMTEFDCFEIVDLRRIPADKLVKTKTQNSSMTVDGYAIIEEPYKTYERGANHETALLNGFNAKEADAFLLSTKATRDNYGELLKPICGNYAEEMTRVMPWNSVTRDQKFIVDAGGEAKGSLNHVYSAAWFTYSHKLWSDYMDAEGRPVYEYYFTKTNKSLSNFHAGELPYAYGNLWRNKGLYTSEDFELSDIMQNCWVNFAKYGDPNGPDGKGSDGTDLPKWERYTKDDPMLMEFGNERKMITDPYEDIYKVLDKYQESR
ncbi:MAG: carboxylesterase family protein [Lachnospiraceae bacterium]|nr:carboxylesterase family protein [Lachnospiraceae bacterium]